MANRDVDAVTQILDDPSIALTTALVTIAVLWALRVVVGPLINDPIAPITVLGLVGGLLGAVGMVLSFDALGFSGPTPAAQFWANTIGEVQSGDAVRPGIYVHLVYAAVMGGLYPWVLGWALGDLMGMLPWGLISGFAFATVLFVLALGYRTIGLFQMQLSVDMLWRYYAYHLVYGFWLGLVVGTNALFFG